MGKKGITVIDFCNLAKEASVSEEKINRWVTCFFNSRATLNPKSKTPLEEERDSLSDEISDAIINHFDPLKSGDCGCGSGKYGVHHKPHDHAGWKPE